MTDQSGGFNEPTIRLPPGGLGGGVGGGVPGGSAGAPFDQPAAGQPSFAPFQPVEVAPPSAPGPKKRRLVPVIGGLVGAALVVGGGIFAFQAISGDSGGGTGGAKTPEAAVEKFVTALGNEDAIGVLESLAPGERDALKDTVLPLVDQLKRLDILDPSTNLNKISGVDLEVKNLKLKSEPLREGFAVVRVISGTIDSKADPKKLPLGKVIRDQAAEPLAQVEPVASTDEELFSPDTPIITVKEGDSWYISGGYQLGYTATGRLPAPGDLVPAKGAPSPDEAVRQFIVAAGNLDLRRIIELLPPDELGALQAYAGQFLPDAQQALVDARQLVKVTFPGLQLTAATRGDRATVKIAKFGIDARVTPPDSDEIRVQFADNCASITADGETKKRCGAEIAKLVEDFGGAEVSTDDLDKVRTSFKPGKQPDAGFEVVRRNGAWYVSPTRTTLDAFTASLKLVEKSDLDKLINEAKKMAGAGLEGLS